MKAKTILGVYLSLVVLFFSCSDSENEIQGTGKLSVRLTDAPFPFDLVAEANVTVFKVEARLADESNEETAMETEDDADENEDGSPFVILMEDEIPVNLLDLTNGNTILLADLVVPQGTYD